MHDTALKTSSNLPDSGDFPNPERNIKIPPAVGRGASESDSEQHFRKEEVQQQTHGVYDGGDEGGSHHRRVEAQAFGDQGEGTAHHLSY